MPSLARNQRSHDSEAAKGGIPRVFCWSKMGSEAGQGLCDIVRRKDLEREAGAGVFAWGIGNSVGPAIKHAKYAEGISTLDALFTPMKSAPKAIDIAPSSITLWLGFVEGNSEVPLEPQMLVTSRGHSGSGEEKRGHYALICRSETSLASQETTQAIDHRAACNLISSNPIGASQVTSVVRYSESKFREASYPVMFRAELTAQSFVRLAMPVSLTGKLLALYRDICSVTSIDQWSDGVKLLKELATPGPIASRQRSLFL